MSLPTVRSELVELRVGMMLLALRQELRVNGVYAYTLRTLRGLPLTSVCPAWIYHAPYPGCSRHAHSGSL